MIMEKGNLSIHSENILPIIKKWLYSDSDIFIREMVSNASDAILKLKKLAEIGEASNIPKDEIYAIHVRSDKEAKTLTFEDNGVGMTADEIREYINQIAFSGASAFLEKYKDKMDKDNEIIGHFGLGFYSCFMVANKVQIDTLSWQPGAEPAQWNCDGGIEYEMSAGERTTRGTTITLYINEESEEFLEEYNLKKILTKYCSFLPVEIFLNAQPEEENEADVSGNTDDQNADKNEDADIIDVDEADVPTTEPKKAPTPINDTNPLWQKAPNECTDEEYKAFYRKVFMDFNEPLFWIHLNMDYPFRLKGILYFPKLKHELEYIEGEVKLYNNQVFVADNIKEVIPEYLLLLKGVMDCPDLPLNVSRSFLQNDGYVKKMSGYISKKVADKLNSLYKKDREQYQSYWEDISPFIKYGCIKEQDFYDKIKNATLYKTTADDYATLEEFLERNKDKTDKKIFYVSNQQLQSQYIKLFKDQDLEAVYLTTQLDNPFISYVENYEQEKEIQFNRIDSDLTDALKQEKEESEEDKKQQEDMENLFRKALGNDKLKVNIETLKSEGISAVVLLSEQSRRMQEMSKAYGGLSGFPGMFDNEESLVLNRTNRLVNTLLGLKDDPDRKEDVNMITCQIYDLAMMSHKPLSNDQMTRFIERSNNILERIAKEK
ncbi:MAG: molecular chaperone HtpG [Defluviitaleaceae bacterium]|nr:molecular chaperone HtpG [Defluviitaleaceae bacterium]